MFLKKERNYIEAWIQVVISCLLSFFHVGYIFDRETTGLSNSRGTAGNILNEMESTHHAVTTSSSSELILVEFERRIYKLPQQTTAR